MSAKVEQPAALACTFLWIGFICAISFLEAWLKFRAPGVTLPIGLSIGRLVFSALNKIEWVFAILIAISAYRHDKRLFRQPLVLLTPALILLVLQTAWLLPQLDARAVAAINGDTLPPSHLHLYFVGAEVVKVILLSRYGIQLFKPV